MKGHPDRPECRMNRSLSVVGIRCCNRNSIGIASWDCGLLIMAVVVDDGLGMVTA